MLQCHTSAQASKGYCISWILLGVLSCGKMSIKAGMKTERCISATRCVSNMALKYVSIQKGSGYVYACANMFDHRVKTKGVFFADFWCILILRRLFNSLCVSNVYVFLYEFITAYKILQVLVIFRHSRATSISVLRNWYHWRSIATGLAFSTHLYDGPAFSSLAFSTTPVRWYRVFQSRVFSRPIHHPPSHAHTHTPDSFCRPGSWLRVLFSAHFAVACTCDVHVVGVRMRNAFTPLFNRFNNNTK